MGDQFKGSAKLAADIRDLVNVRGADQLTIMLDDRSALRLAKILDDVPAFEDIAGQATGAIVWNRGRS